jgi:DNA repair photolyase
MSNYAIYQPKNKAAEYAEWACNFYVGCSNNCSYCYLKKGIGAKVLGGNVPTLKKCFKDESHALEVFEKELKANLPELQKHGLFFSFTTDPCLRKTFDLTMQAMSICLKNNVPVTILTKVSVWVDFFLINISFSNNSFFVPNWESLILFMFTLTGRDDLEPNASTNQERIEAMKKLHAAGFKTGASIEPIVELVNSFQMICETNCICDIYKIGIESGKKYEKSELRKFVYNVIRQNEFSGSKIYYKDSLLKQVGITREDLPENCVTRDYNLFK